MSSLRVDHVIYAVADLEAAAARVTEELGLGSIQGGRHPGWGTANRIVPLGREYLELMTVVDAAEAAESVVGRAVLEAIEAGERLVGWAVATDDIEVIARRLSLEIIDGSRTRPDGVTLSWKLAGVGRGLETSALPFFIQWEGAAELHPGSAKAGHRVTPGGIAWVEVSTNEQALRAWLGGHDLPLRVIDGPDALSAVAISTSDGEIVFR